MTHAPPKKANATAHPPPKANTIHTPPQTATPPAHGPPYKGERKKAPFENCKGQFVSVLTAVDSGSSGCTCLLPAGNMCMRLLDGCKIEAALELSSNMPGYVDCLAGRLERQGLPQMGFG